LGVTIEQGSEERGEEHGAGRAQDDQP
jgi:hypothetical protein